MKFFLRNPSLLECRQLWKQRAAALEQTPQGQAAVEAAQALEGVAYEDPDDGKKKAASKEKHAAAAV